MNSNNDKPDRVPVLLVEQLALGELDDATAKNVRARLEQEPGGLDRLVAIERSNTEILEALPPEQVAHQVRTALSLDREDRPQGDKAPRRAPSRLWAALPVAATAAAVALIALLPGADDALPMPAPIPEEIRTKGLEPGLVIHQRAADGIRRLQAGDAVPAGAMLQLSYRAAGAGYGVIVSVDGAGAVTRHFPREGSSAKALERGGRVALDHAYELDNAPSHERFFFVVSSGPFSVDAVMSAARAMGSAKAGALQLPAGLEQTSLLVAKEPGR